MNVATIIARNKRFFYLTADDQGDYTVLSLSGGVGDLDLGDQIKGKLDREGNQRAWNVTKSEDVDICVEHCQCPKPMGFNLLRSMGDDVIVLPGHQPQ